MGRYHDGPRSSDSFGDNPSQQPRRSTVELRRRFIKKYDIGVSGQRSSDTHPLALASRESPVWMGSHRSELQLRKERCGDGACTAPVGCTGGPEGDVVKRGPSGKCSRSLVDERR